eukprot:388876-Pyramimonas_sp.AAC.2
MNPYRCERGNKRQVHQLAVPASATERRCAAQEYRYCPAAAPVQLEIFFAQLRHLDHFYHEAPDVLWTNP